MLGRPGGEWRAGGLARAGGPAAARGSFRANFSTAAPSPSNGFANGRLVAALERLQIRSRSDWILSCGGSLLLMPAISTVVPPFATPPPP